MNVKDIDLPVQVALNLSEFSILLSSMTKFSYISFLMNIISGALPMSLVTLNRLYNRSTLFSTVCPNTQRVFITPS